MNKIRPLCIFMAYQFSASRISKTEREQAIARAVVEANATLHEKGLSFTVSWQSLDLESWPPVGPQILDAISQSAIFLADVSELNANVLFELGFAVGLRRRLGCLPISIIAHEEFDFRSLPTDLLGGYVARYTELTFQSVVENLVRKAVLQLAPALADGDVREAWGTLWALDGKKQVDVICSEIPEDNRPEFAIHRHPNYLRYAKFADLDSLILVHDILAREFSDICVRDYGATESVAQHENGILIGGAAWNSRVQRIQECLPFRYVDADNPETDSLLINSDGVQMLFMSQFAPSGIPINDYFVFARLHPDGGSNLLLFGGGLTHGVLGAVKTFSHIPPGPMNACFLGRHTAPNAEIIVVGKVEHRDGYLRVCDFSVTPPCLILQRMNGEAEFHTVMSGCTCNIHRIV